MHETFEIVLRRAVCLLVICFTSLPAAALTIEHMTTNGRTNPQGIGDEDISFSWAMNSEQRGMGQSAYHIRVGTTKEADDVWDCGRVASDRQIDIALPADVHLKAATRYYWQVRIWDGDGVVSDWSEPAWFETGLLFGANWSGAEWIARPAEKVDIKEWTDYTVELEYCVKNAAFGVFLRTSPDAQNGYMYQISVDGDRPLLRPHRRANGGYTVLEEVDLSEFGFTSEGLLEGRHRMVLEVRGSNVVTTMDGKEIKTNTDLTFNEGLVGFRTYGPESGTVYRVKVTDTVHGRLLVDTDFSNPNLEFTGGTVSDGVYQVSGYTDAVFKNKEKSLPLLRGVFRAWDEVKNARIYVSAHGLYELYLNGYKVGDQFLAPGWTDYDHRIQAQAYDITGLVNKGANVVGAALADGWYRGNLGIHWSGVYGDRLALIAKIKLTYTDGSTEWFGTDRWWQVGDGPFVSADLQDGEIYDARLEQPRWCTADFDASGWNPVEVLPNDSHKLVPQPDEPVRVTEVLTAKTRTIPAAGRYVYDLGQNMVGVARITMAGKKDQTVTIRYGEELYRTGGRRGQLYTDNLRLAKATDSYTFGADGVATYQPTFTQHGFRYVEITGLDVPPRPEDVKGIVLGSDLPDIGELETSNPMLNQLVSNIRWGQRGNFLSIPTDTPARDERLGWTGDISVFAPTACRYKDTRAFLSKWMDDVRDAQKPDGNIPAVVPQPRNEFNDTGVGWSDAFITIPYAVWRSSGDTRIVRRNWKAMKRFYGFIYTSATEDGNLLEEGRSSWFSGDWLNLEVVDRLEEHKVIATAYFAENTRMMAEMAAAMGDTEQAEKWAALIPKIRKEFVDVYIQPDGSVYMGTQTVYAMALGMDLIADQNLRGKTADKFIEKLATDDYHLKTGFLGTPWLLPALTCIGRDDLAMRLLLNEDYPSWGFEIRMGATTMWERWNTIRADGEFGPVDMNSFNHYAYGAVGDWMFAHLGGLQIIEPGYKKARIAPLIGPGGLNEARCSLRIPYGLLVSEWSLVDGELTLKATVPVNTTAEIIIPAKNTESVYEGDALAVSAPGVKTAEFKDGQLILLVGSGRYEFTVRDTH